MKQSLKYSKSNKEYAIVNHNIKENIDILIDKYPYHKSINKKLIDDINKMGYDDASYVAGLEEGILLGGQSGDANGDGPLDVLDIVYFVDVILYP